MDFEIDVFLPKEKELTEAFGLNPSGKVQKVVDTTFIHYMKLKMPQDSGMMIANTRNSEPGLVTVETPYAHYMNEGILYVDPKYQKGAFHDPISGMFWSRPGIKKVPSDKQLNYRGGSQRGAHFVERTIEENTEDIIKAGQKEIDKR